MCFVYDDYDWIAQVVEVEESESGPATKCMECNRSLTPEEWRRHTKLQQWECCRRCDLDTQDIDEDEVEELSKGDCEKDGCDFGETEEHDVCRACTQILAAIKISEIEAGCRESESQPAAGFLWDALLDDWERYYSKAVEMFPELATESVLLIKIRSLKEKE